MAAAVTTDPWVESVSLALSAVSPPLPAGLPEPPRTPEELLEWLPAVVRASRRQCADLAKARAAKASRRGFLRGEGAKAVARAVAELAGDTPGA